MKIHSAIILLGFCMISISQDIHVNAQPATPAYRLQLFDTSTEHHYWQALIEISRGNKQCALDILSKLGNQTHISFSWQDDLPANIDDFFDKLFVELVRNDPQLLTYLSLFESIGVHAHNAHLTNISAQSSIKNMQDAKAHLLSLRQYANKALSAAQKTSYNICLWLLEQQIAGEKFLFHSYKINQMDGALMDLHMVLTEFHSIKNTHDVENYIARLHNIPVYLQQATEYIQLQTSKGIVPPRFAIEKVLASIQKIIPEQIDNNIFYAYVKKELSKNADVACQELLAKASAVITETVYPAYISLQHYFTQLLETTTQNKGVWALPDGDEYYAYMLREHTSTTLSADEIHTLGLQEVAKIHHEIREILASENIIDPNKSVGQLIQEFAKDPQFYYPNSPEGRAQCIADFCAIVERSRKELAHLFDLKPETGVVIQEVPAHEQDGSAAAYYYAPSIDGSRPGIFFANLKDMNSMPKYGMETLAIHEAEPGHHFQLALQNTMQIPMLRKLSHATAYCEGWALYTEKLAYEHNFYSSSFSKIGHLQDELLRAARLVIDTGIHHKQWSREQAITYMQETVGYDYDSVVTEVERYFVLPGQACAYKIGQLKILELRKRAQNMLGSKFDIREFHNEVLQLGAAPLMVLEEVINEYIQRKLIQT